MAITDHGKYVISTTQSTWLQFNGIVAPDAFKLYTNGTHAYLAYTNSTNATYAGRSDGPTNYSFVMKTVPDMDTFSGTVGILNYNETNPTGLDFNVVKGSSIYKYDLDTTVDNPAAERGLAVFAGPVDSKSATNPCGLWDRFAVQFNGVTGDTLARTEFPELTNLRYRVLIPTASGMYVFGLEQTAGATDPGPLRIYKITMPNSVGPVEGTCVPIYTGTTNFIGTAGFGPRIYPLIESGTEVSKFLVLCQTSTTVGSITADALVFDMTGALINSETNLSMSIADIFDSSQSWTCQSGGLPGFSEGAIYMRGVLDPTSSFVNLYKYVVDTGEFHNYQLVDSSGSAPSMFELPLIQRHLTSQANTGTLIEFSSLGFVNDTYSGLDKFDVMLMPYEEPMQGDDVVQLISFY